jgi:chitodextrinase
MEASMILRTSMKKALLLCGASAAALLLSLYACDNADTIKPAAGPDGTDTEAPSVPVGLSAAAESESSMNIAWSPSTDDVGVEGYHVYRDGSAVGVAASPSYLDTGLAAGTSYSYEVSAFDSSGNESARSSPETGTIPGGSQSGYIYKVGPARTYTSIQQLEAILAPGDVVLVDGGVVYAGGITFSNAGTEAQPITIRGVKVNGNRPVIQGGNNVVEFNQNN